MSAQQYNDTLSLFLVKFNEKCKNIHTPVVLYCGKSTVPSWELTLLELLRLISLLLLILLLLDCF